MTNKKLDTIKCVEQKHMFEDKKEWKYLKTIMMYHKNIKKNRILLKLVILLTIFAVAWMSDLYYQRNYGKITKISFDLSEQFRGWQGIATNGSYIYVVTDRDKNFKLEDIISVYDMKGNLIKEKHNAYTKTDEKGKFMSFGGISINHNRLYATVYNINGGGKPYISRVIEYSLPKLTIVGEHDIGAGVAESIQKYDGSYWVTYYDKQKIGRFDLKYHHIKDYMLSQPMGQYGGYQGMMWYGGKMYVNMHGPNKYGKTPEVALDCYAFDGKKFIYLKTMKPATYGTTQDIEYFNHWFYWNDRPGNKIIITNRLQPLH